MDWAFSTSKRHQPEWNRLDYQPLFRKGACTSRPDSTDQWKSSQKTEIRTPKTFWLGGPTPVPQGIRACFMSSISTESPQSKIGCPVALVGQFASFAILKITHYTCVALSTVKTNWMNVMHINRVRHCFACMRWTGTRSSKARKVFGPVKP